MYRFYFANVVGTPGIDINHAEPATDFMLDPLLCHLCNLVCQFDQHALRDLDAQPYIENIRPYVLGDQIMDAPDSLHRKDRLLYCLNNFIRE